MIKKISFITIIILSLFLITGCDKKVEGSLEEIMTKVYENIKEEERPMMLTNMEVNSDNIEYYLGTNEIEYEEALASESAVGSIAHSVVLLRAKPNSDIESIKTKIKESINPRKWICVGVDEKDIIVENKGDLIILILVEDSKTRQTLEKGFNNL
ncbi:MAG: hypothetical protein IJB82_01610 [Bacilli bacterium]|nr:hypothetical protein [Bacilli bacterium]